MSDAAWKITRNGRTFELAVTVRSEHRPETAYQRQGRIKIDQSGNQHLENIFLVEAGETNRESKKATAKEIALYICITHENNPAAVFTKIAKICDEESQRMERYHVEREKREQKAMEQVNASLRRLTELEDEGIHNIASYEERTEEGAERWKTSTDMN